PGHLGGNRWPANLLVGAGVARLRNDRAMAAARGLAEFRSGGVECSSRKRASSDEAAWGVLCHAAGGDRELPIAIGRGVGGIASERLRGQRLLRAIPAGVSRLETADDRSGVATLAERAGRRSCHRNSTGEVTRVED